MFGILLSLGRHIQNGFLKLLLNRLTENGSELVVFDIILSESDSNDPALGKAIKNRGSSVIWRIVFGFDPAVKGPRRVVYDGVIPAGDTFNYAVQERLANIGAEGKKMDYTVIGDTVNLGSRIESLTKRYGSRILVSESTMIKIRPLVEAGVIGHLSVKGLDPGAASFVKESEDDSVVAFDEK